MARKPYVKPTRATDGVRQGLGDVQDWLGMTPDIIMKIMTASPSVLSGYIDFSATLAGGVLYAKFREQIALAVSRANQSEVSIAFHSEVASHRSRGEC